MKTISTLAAALVCLSTLCLRPLPAEAAPKALSAAEAEYQAAMLVFLGERDTAKLIAGCQKALKLDAGHLPARYQLASVLYAEDRWKEARKEFANIVGRAPDSELSVKSRARVAKIDQLLERLNTPEALRHFRYLRRLQAIRAKTGDHAEATREIGSLIVDYPGYYEGYFVQAGLDSATGDYEAALKSASRGLSVAPPDKRNELEEIVGRLKNEQRFDAAMKTATGHLRAAKFDLAAKTFEEANGFLPARLEATLAAASAHQQAANYSRARDLLLRVQREGDLEQALRASRGLQLIEPLVTAVGEADADMASRQGGGDFLKARGQLSGGKLDEALRSVSDAIDALKIDPAYSRYFALRARIQMRKENLAAAREDYNRALAVNPNDSDARRELAQLHYSQENYLEALSELRRIADGHRDLAYHTRRAELEIRLGDLDGAGDTLKQAQAQAKTAHDQEVVKSWQVKLAAEQGRTAEANAALADMQKKRPSGVNPAGAKGASNAKGKKPKIDFSILDKK